MGVEAVERERRVVSVVFCDLVGSTAAAEDADPEDVHLALSAFHHAVRDRVLSFGGVVEKYVGDAIMAIFGVPVAHEDDAERAVRAALSLAADAMAGRLPDIRVGVNTGEVLAVLGANPERGESTVLGDVVNTAARLQGAALTNTVVVGELTHRATDRVFEYAELEPTELKGKKGLVRLWQPLAAKARYGADVLRDLTTPIVGRDDDIAALEQSFRRVAAGQGAELVAVIGEPGVGKSRLVAELLERLDQHDARVTWRQGRCPPYGAAVPYSALGDIVKAELGVYDNDPADAVMAKLEDGVAADGAAGLRAILAPLLGLPGSSQVTRETQFSAWSEYLTGLTRENPVVLVVEDLHWADEGLIEFLPELVTRAGLARLLVVASARPELLADHPDWAAGTERVSQVSLATLDAADTEVLLSNIMGDVELAASTRIALVERCEGNPLHAEEFARLVRDSGDHALDADALPDSLQSLISARLDTLAPRPRSLLQDAAVVGKTFWTGTAAALSGRDEADVEDDLRELVGREFLRPLARSSIVGQREWSFVHALIRDVAYQHLARADRATRHLVVADWLGGAAGARPEDMAEIVIHHALTAHDLATATDDDVLVEKSRSVAVDYGLIALGNPPGLPPEQFEQLPRQIAPLVRPGTPEEGVFLAAQTWITVLLGKPGAYETGRRAVELLRGQDRPQELAKALRLSALASMSAGAAEQAKELLREAVRTLEPHGPSSELVCDLADLAVYVSGDDIATTREIGDRALAMARGIPLTGYAEGNARWRGLIASVYGKEESDPRALELLDEALAVAERWAPTAIVRLTADKLDYVAPQQGPETAVQVAEEALTHRALVPYNLHQLRGSMLPNLRLAGRLREALRVAQETWDAWDRMGNTGPADLTMAERVMIELELGHAAQQIVGGAELLERCRSRSSEWDGLEAPTMFSAGTQLAAASGDTAVARQLLSEVPVPEVGRGLLPVLGGCLRSAAELDAPDEIERLTARLSEDLPLGAAMLSSARGLLQEGSDTELAGHHFRDAVQRHRALGSRLEEMYALEGLARCLVALGDSSAPHVTEAAERLLVSMRSAEATAQRVAVPSV